MSIIRTAFISVKVNEAVPWHAFSLLPGVFVFMRKKFPELLHVFVALKSLGFTFPLKIVEKRIEGRGQNIFIIDNPAQWGYPVRQKERPDSLPKPGRTFAFHERIHGLLLPQTVQKGYTMKSIQKKEWIRTLKFLFFSVSAGLIEMLAFSLLNELTSWSYWPCYLIALVLSVVWNFTLNRRFTFQSANNIPVAMLKVFAFYCVFTPLSTIGGNYLAENLGWNEYLVTILNMVVNFVLEFLYQRFFVFRDSIDTNEVARKQKEKELAGQEKIQA